MLYITISVFTMNSEIKLDEKVYTDMKGVKEKKIKEDCETLYSAFNHLLNISLPEKMYKYNVTRINSEPIYLHIIDDNKSLEQNCNISLEKLSENIFKRSNINLSVRLIGKHTIDYSNGLIKLDTNGRAPHIIQLRNISFTKT